jgi:predicted RNA binding protein YcfA (HicA-like mRNA interferase family)
VSSFEKLVQKFLYDQNSISANDVRMLCDGFGYEEYKSPGSHLAFRKKGKPPLTVSTVSGKNIKKYNVKKIVNFFNLEEYFGN